MSLLAVGTLNGRVKILVASTNEVLFDVQGHHSYVKGATFSPDGQVLATVGNDGCCKLWHSHEGEELLVIRGHDGKQRCLCEVDEDGVCFCEDSGCPVTGHGGEGQHPGVMSVAWAPDGKELASGGKDGSVLLWDRTGKVRARLKRHDESVLGVAFAPDNRRLVSGAMDGKVHVWDLAAAAPGCSPLRTITGHPLGVLCLAIAPDGASIATAGFDRLVKLWNLSTGAHVGHLPAHREPVRSVCFSPDGRLLLSASDDMAICVWDPHELKLKKALRGHDFLEGCLCDRKSGVKDPNCLVRGHRAGVRSIAFAPSGEFVASGSYDRTARLMDAKAPSFDVLRRVAVDTEVVVVALGPKDKPAEARHKDSEWMQSFFPRIV